MTKLLQKKPQNNQQKSKLWKELPILTPPAENVSKFAPFRLLSEMKIVHYTNYQ